MDKIKLEKIVAELTQQEAAQVSGGATLTEKTVNVRDWDASVIEGCCGQGCCEEN